jgi:hypothetical protein
MKVKNINGTSANTCKCGNWLEHWKRNGGKTPAAYCAELLCRNTQEVGAHVQVDGSTDRTWYIVPLCKEHNSKTGQSISLMEGTTLVPANVSETCGKALASYLR